MLDIKNICSIFYVRYKKYFAWFEKYMLSIEDICSV